MPTAALTVLVSVPAGCGDEPRPKPPVEDAGPGDASPGDSGPGDSGPGDAGGCPTGGSATLVLGSTGLPASASGMVEIVASDGGTQMVAVGSEATRVTVASGTVRVGARTTTLPDPVVRPVYRGRVEGLPADGCVRPGAEVEVTVRWERVPTSQHIWMSVRADAGTFGGLSSMSARTAGRRPLDVTVRAGIGDAFAFDRDGNVWSAGATTTDPHLQRFAASAFAMSGRAEPDRRFMLEGVGCGPIILSMALESSGGLWITVTCLDQVWRLPAPSLSSSGTLSPEVRLMVADPTGLALDAAGNLWVASAGRVLRFDASRLASGAMPAASLRVQERRGMGAPRDLSAEVLVFDAEGGLWVVDDGANALAYLPRASLSATGESTVMVDRVVYVSVTALPEQPAFDESGGLWMAGSMGRLVRFAPEQLRMSSSPGSPTTPERVIELDAVSYVEQVGLFPAPANLPLHHALP
ncbi:MAG: hypothetical protein NZ898_13615 [Myxococcota bacterium]|nr:hypothetical protein [Myxococcota bacterium]MDW8363155.1 hypothetical protein [Myxococcales bacterium]